MWARGVLAVHRYLVTTMCSTPSVARLRAAVAPAGPVPTTSTSVWIVSVIGAYRSSGRSHWWSTQPFTDRPRDAIGKVWVRPRTTAAARIDWATVGQAGNNAADTLGPVGKDNA